MMRTFTTDSIAMASDQKGKVGKFEKAKPISVDFQSTVNAPVGGADKLLHRVRQGGRGHDLVPGRHARARADFPRGGLKKYTKTIPAPPLDPGQPVFVEGNGNKGKLMKGKHGFTLAGSKLVKTVTPYASQTLRLPKPNMNNIGDEMYLQPLNLTIGLGTGVGLPASIGPNAKNKPIIHHISLPKWKDVTKTLYKFKNVVILQNERSVLPGHDQEQGKHQDAQVDRSGQDGPLSRTRGSWGTS